MSNWEFSFSAIGAHFQLSLLLQFHFLIGYQVCFHWLPSCLEWSCLFFFFLFNAIGDWNSSIELVWVFIFLDSSALSYNSSFLFRIIIFSNRLISLSIRLIMLFFSHSMQLDVDFLLFILPPLIELIWVLIFLYSPAFYYNVWAIEHALSGDWYLFFCSSFAWTSEFVFLEFPALYFLWSIHV